MLKNSYTQTQHILNICHLKILIGDVLLGVNPCERCASMAVVPQIAKLMSPKKITK